MKLKIFRNIAPEQSVDSKALSIEEIPPDSISPLHSQHRQIHASTLSMAHHSFEHATTDVMTAQLSPDSLRQLKMI